MSASAAASLCKALALAIAPLSCSACAFRAAASASERANAAAAVSATGSISICTASATSRCVRTMVTPKAAVATACDWRSDSRTGQSLAAPAYVRLGAFPSAPNGICDCWRWSLTCLAGHISAPPCVTQEAPGAPPTLTRATQAASRGIRPWGAVFPSSSSSSSSTPMPNESSSAPAASGKTAATEALRRRGPPHVGPRAGTMTGMSAPASRRPLAHNVRAIARARRCGLAQSRGVAGGASASPACERE
mmetsp:Transcript_66872/g.193648  ORF Transcript_66872/g.193648 Transcript_66872/m.193648 type:complete len:249 (-) Transcript_66872:297-1043(-)